MRIVNQPPNWLCNHPLCREMATTVFELKPYCRQHMLQLIGEMVPRNRAEQRFMAKQIGMSGGPNRRRKRFRSRPYWQRRALEELIRLDLEERESKRQAAVDEADRGRGWVENEAGILAPA